MNPEGKISPSLRSRSKESSMVILAALGEDLTLCFSIRTRTSPVLDVSPSRQIIGGSRDTGDIFISFKAGQ